MQRVPLVIGLFLLAATAHADPRAMMMQGAWMQSRQSRVASTATTPLTIGVHKAPPRVRVPKVATLKKTAATKPRSAKTPTAPKEKVASEAQPIPVAAVAKPAASTTPKAPPEHRHGFFGHLMFHLGQATGSAMKKPRAWLSRLFGAAQPKEKRVIRYGSMPVGLLLTPLRNNALNIRLSPEGLVGMRRARLISDTEFQLLMGQLQLGL